jgi:hypothetical protein
MEPERNIEKLLRAYAKKRRAQAGDPLELHPAARRLLQGEIARHTPKPDDEDASLTLWELFRQQWAVLLGFALMVFFVATLLLPGLNAAKNKARKTTAMTRYHLIEIGTALRMFAEDNHERLPASLDEMTNELQLDLANTIFIDPQNGRRFVYVGGGKYLGNLPSNSVLAYSPTDKKGRAVLFADGRVEVINGARFSELTNSGMQALAFAKDSGRRQLAEPSKEITAASGIAAAAPPILGRLKAEDYRKELKSGDLGIAATNAVELAANVPATPTETADRLTSAHTREVQFASAASQSSALNLKNTFKNTITPAKAVPVLVNFQVQQNGNAVRVVDADGSVYDGSLLPESAVAQIGPALAQVERAKTIASREEAQSAQIYSFRVTGMNQTLKQNVVFAGNLVAMANATANLQHSSSGSGGNQMPSAPTNQSPWPWSNSRIAGTAVIADTNHIEINAVPQSP